MTAQVTAEPDVNGASITTSPLTLEIHDLDGINVIAMNSGLNSRVSVSVQATLVFNASR